MVVTHAQLVVEVISMENGVMSYSVEFYCDDDVKYWSSISLVIVLMSSVLIFSTLQWTFEGLHWRFAFIFIFSHQVLFCFSVCGGRACVQIWVIKLLNTISLCVVILVLKYSQQVASYRRLEILLQYFYKVKIRILF